MAFKKGNKPWNTGKKGYKRDQYPNSYYERNRELLIKRAIETKQASKIKKAGRPKTPYCEGCGKVTSKVVFDHNHKTGKFRGWLCKPCNSALGFVFDNVAILEGLKYYLLREYVVEQLESKGIY